MPANNKKKITPLNAVFITAAAFIIIIALLLPILPHKTFSEKENRYLAEFPEFSLSEIVSGEFMDGLNTFLEDHFPGRDLWISVKTEYEIICGSREINGIYLAKDNYLMEDYKAPESTERITSTLAAMNDKLKEQKPGISSHLMLIPTSAVIYEEKLPSGASIYDQQAVRAEIAEGSGFDYIDCYDELMANKDGDTLYYTTDHHWTTLGAYYGYVSYCEAVGLTPTPLDEFDSEVVTEDFHGTYSSKVLRPFEQGDPITVYYDPQSSLTVTYDDTGEVTDTLYNLSYTEEKDKYSLFLNNLHPLITVENSQAESDNALLLVKDSYANSMVPFLTRHYKTIYILDTRYYKNGPMSFINEHEDITDFLILYNMGTIDTDTGIRGIY